jgi:hypothetical protein
MRIRPVIVLALTAALIVAGGAALAAPTDLSTWPAVSYPGNGSAVTAPGVWVVDVTGTEVVQTVNGAPTLLVSPQEATGQRIRASFTTPIADNDYFGVALGFTAGEESDPAADYLLIDWRQGDQDFSWFGGEGPTTAHLGLAVSRVTGAPNLNEFWGHVDETITPGAGLTELARGATLGAAGWADATTYEFVIEYDVDRLRVWVDGTLEIDVAGALPSGPFALYDFSQPEMRFGAITFEPLNQPPEIATAAADVIVDEGQVGSTGGTFVDPDADTLTLSCLGSCAGFSDEGGGIWSWSQLLVEGPEAFSVTVTASDGMLEATDSFDVTVHNLAPVITTTSGVSATSSISDPVVVSADFTDAGIEDTHTAQFDWGDGMTSVGAVAEVPGSGTTTGTHTYAAPGSYTITVTVWDDDGASDQAVVGTVFVFDPDTFVTGGGWIASPAGAWTEQPDHSGKLTFGFVVRYDNAGRLRGNLQLQLHKGLNLHATSFELLLIDGGIARFSGAARVNGEPGYEFSAVVTDERWAAASDDLFWITVERGGATVYDGGVLPADGLPIKGRGIQIHRR